jgi:hypothetical protein
MIKGICKKINDKHNDHRNDSIILMILCSKSFKMIMIYGLIVWIISLLFNTQVYLNMLFAVVSGFIIAGITHPKENRSFEWNFNWIFYSLCVFLIYSVFKLIFLMFI